MDAAFHLVKLFKDRSVTVTPCIEGIKNFAYLFNRETISLDILELMESKLISEVNSCGMTGFEILSEISAFYEGMDDELVESIELIFAIYGDGEDSSGDIDEIHDVKFKENASCTKAEAKRFLNSD
jgi:hypothetical protein